MEALDGRWKRALARGLLVLSSLLVAFCLIELLILPRLLVRAPLRYQFRFSLLMQVLSQHSKRGLIPRDYVLLVGDSYAKGYGDWLDTADPDGNGPFHSADVIHEILQQDVLSYGKGGAGSIAGLVLFPARWDLALGRRGLDPPQTVAVYFYEGNDLNDNRRYLRHHYPGGPDDPSLMDDAVFDGFLQQRLDGYLAKKSLLDTTLTAAFVYKRVRGVIEGWWKSWQQEGEPAPAWPAGYVPINLVRVGGRVIELPSRLQSPALELTPEERTRALQVTRRCLALLVARYPSSRVILFRIPSPLATYELASEQVDVESYEGRDTLYPAGRVEVYSDAIGHALAGFAAELGIEYVDLRPVLRRAARERPMHGPLDWQHPNQDGYTVLGEAVAERIAAGRPRPDSSSEVSR